ncbi:ARL14 effector protein [Anthonomus grandis grandis]|uniref:ARL14 effector protein n=1 Tax=Anthonomus grandis grandis TaxID=2921223 RepID=UPI002165A62B|nr:ARL14 effector protein [Anthonomus grandis grandis]
MDSESSDEEYNPERSRTARKSASTPTPAYSTRRQAARNASKAISASSFDKSMENFNPDLSQRERRKISKKFSSGTTRKPSGALYDEKGIHIASGRDLCDCLSEKCPGCWFECIKCEGTKCGAECRVYRKYVVDSIEFHGYDITIKNPILRN